MVANMIEFLESRWKCQQNLRMDKNFDLFEFHAKLSRDDADVIKL